MQTHESLTFEKFILAIILLLVAINSYSCVSAKIQKVFQKTADQVESVDYQQTMAVRGR